MNIGRFLGASIGVWIVRVALNWTFYTKIVGHRFEQISSAHPGVFRNVIPGFIGTDLLFSLVFALLFVKVGAALGGGVKGGVKLGMIIAVLSVVVGRLYEFFGATYLAFSLVLADWAFQLIAHAIEGAVAGVIYKTQAQNV